MVCNVEGPNTEHQEHLGEMIQRTARVIESLLGNIDAGRLFVEQGGVEAMLLLYELPNLNPGFGTHSPLHAVTSALRILAQHHAKALAKLLAESLGARLVIMEQEALVGFSGSAWVFCIKSNSLELERIASSTVWDRSCFLMSRR